jgi:hypothetical protein
VVFEHSFYILRFLCLIRRGPSSARDANSRPNFTLCRPISDPTTAHLGMYAVTASLRWLAESPDPTKRSRPGWVGESAVNATGCAADLPAIKFETIH